MKAVEEVKKRFPVVSAPVVEETAMEDLSDDSDTELANRKRTLEKILESIGEFTTGLNSIDS